MSLFVTHFQGRVYQLELKHKNKHPPTSIDLYIESQVYVYIHLYIYHNYAWDSLALFLDSPIWTETYLVNRNYPKVFAHTCILKCSSSRR